MNEFHKEMQKIIIVEELRKVEKRIRGERI